MREYLAEDLIQAVRDRAALGSSVTEGTTDDDILRYLNDEALTRLYNAVMHVREEYFVKTEAISVVAGTVRYRIPHRAMQTKLRDVYFVDTDGTRLELLPRPRSERSYYTAYTSSSGRPTGFVYEGNHLILLPDNATDMSGTLEVAYFQRPGELVLSTECRQVSDVTAGVITLSSDVPTEWTTGISVDIHSGYSGAETKAWDITPSLVSGSQLTCTVAALDGSVAGRIAVEVGDWVCLSETAALPALPREWHPVLAQAAAVSIMESIDPERFPAAEKSLEKAVERMYEAISSRDDGYTPGIDLRNSLHGML